MKITRFSALKQPVHKLMHLLGAFLLLWMIPMLHQRGFGQAIQPKAYDKFFRTVDLHGRQVHPILSPCFRKVTRLDLPFLPSENTTPSYCSIGKFFLDSLGRYQGYLLQIPDDDRIDLFVIDKANEKVLLAITAADYIEIVHAMQSTTNTWLFDHNQDGVLDVLVATELIDHEAETADAPNISGTERFCYTFVDGQMVYGEWPQSQKWMPLMGSK